MWHAWERNVYRVLMGKPEGKRPLERPRRRWEGGIRMDLREIGWGSVDWIQLAQDRDRWRALVNTAINLRVLAPRTSLVISTMLYMNQTKDELVPLFMHHALMKYGGV
jgi:hypothetical protein